MNMSYILRNTLVFCKMFRITLFTQSLHTEVFSQHILIIEARSTGHAAFEALLSS